MSEPVSNAEIEDVLASIRRLVSENAKALKRDRERQTDAEKLVLTPAHRIDESQAEPHDGNVFAVDTETWNDAVRKPHAPSGDDVFAFDSETLRDTPRVRGGLRSDVAGAASVRADDDSADPHRPTGTAAGLDLVPDAELVEDTDEADVDAAEADVETGEADVDTTEADVDTAEAFADADAPEFAAAPAETRDGSDLERQIAELEAAVDRRSDELEPDENESVAPPAAILDLPEGIDDSVTWALDDDDMADLAEAEPEEEAAATDEAEATAGTDHEETGATPAEFAAPLSDRPEESAADMGDEGLPAAEPDLDTAGPEAMPEAGPESDLDMPTPAREAGPAAKPGDRSFVSATIAFVAETLAKSWTEPKAAANESAEPAAEIAAPAPAEPAPVAAFAETDGPEVEETDAASPAASDEYAVEPSAQAETPLDEPETVVDDFEAAMAASAAEPEVEPEPADLAPLDVEPVSELVLGDEVDIAEPTDEADEQWPELAALDGATAADVEAAAAEPDAAETEPDLEPLALDADETVEDVAEPERADDAPAPDMPDLADETEAETLGFAPPDLPEGDWAELEADTFAEESVEEADVIEEIGTGSFDSAEAENVAAAVASLVETGDEGAEADAEWAAEVLEDVASIEDRADAAADADDVEAESADADGADLGEDGEADVAVEDATEMDDTDFAGAAAGIAMAGAFGNGGTEHRDAADDAAEAADAAAAIEDETLIDEEMLRQLVAQLVREELQGTVGERITHNVRRLIRREIARALSLQELE